MEKLRITSPPELIRYYMHKAGFSQVQLAIRLKVSDAAISTAIKGAKKLSKLRGLIIEQIEEAL